MKRCETNKIPKIINYEIMNGGKPNYVHASSLIKASGIEKKGLANQEINMIFAETSRFIIKEQNEW